MKRLRTPFLFVLFLLLGACSIQVGKEFQTNCEPLPSAFNTQDIVGKWVNYRVGGETDTLIIREDGFYKQLIDLEAPASDFESDWLPWRIENTDLGIAYLHISNMNACLYSLALDCSDPQNGFLEKPSFGWNYCTDQSMTFDDELILIVRGTRDPSFQSSRGIVLTSLQIFTEDGITGYILQDE